MANQMQQNYEQELLARGQQIGQQIGEARGQLRAYRTLLSKQLQKRFGALPASVVQRIEAADLPWLDAALDRVE